MLRVLWRLTTGYRLRPWRSPYLRWRMETYWGLHADEITFSQFWKLLWRERRELRRYLRWATGMRRRAERQNKPVPPAAVPYQPVADTEPRPGGRR